MLDLERAISQEPDGQQPTVAALVRTAPTLREHDTLEQAVLALGSTDDEALPVLGEDDQLIGWLTHRRLLRAYRARLSHARPTSGTGSAGSQQPAVAYLASAGSAERLPYARCCHSHSRSARMSGCAGTPWLAVLLAFPVAMALATGTEAPATSIAQLGQLRNRGRWLFGRGTLLLTIAIVGALTLSLTALAVHLHVGVPRADSTQIADLAQTATGKGGLFAFFQLASGLLLLAAASSSFQAGPAQDARAWAAANGAPGLLPAPLARSNRHHTPVTAVIVYGLISAAIVLISEGTSTSRSWCSCMRSPCS